ncbi:MAG: aspartyl protease family protein [Aquaticitalea sp.]
MLKRITLTSFLVFVTAICLAQGNFNLINTHQSKLRFELINNLIVIPVEVNGVKLSFLLDSGVSKPILFNIINLSDSLQINHVESVFLRGLGDKGSIEALKSKNNVVKIGNAINVNQEIFVVFDEGINFAPRLGVPIHGIIGYDIFKDFIVEINYSSKYIKFHDPLTYIYKNCKKCQTLDLTLSQNKPYINGTVKINSQDIPVKLLVDSGGSDALWLFEDPKRGIMPKDKKYFEDYLGMGLSGSVYGKRSKIESFSLQSFEFNDVNVAFPDSTSISIAKNLKDRRGSISGELLKRFNMIVDYPNGIITLRKNSNFKQPFHYNKSGIVLEQNGIRVVKESNDRFLYNDTDNKNETNKVVIQSSYRFALKPAYTIVELRKGSPAERAGFLLGDIILTVNNKDAANLKLQDINDLFSEEDGKLVRIKIDRDGRPFDYSFRLEKLF